MILRLTWNGRFLFPSGTALKQDQRVVLSYNMGFLQVQIQSGILINLPSPLAGITIVSPFPFPSLPLRNIFFSCRTLKLLNKSITVKQRPAVNIL